MTAYIFNHEQTKYAVVAKTLDHANEIAQDCASRFYIFDRMVHSFFITDSRNSELRTLFSNKETLHIYDATKKEWRIA